MEEIINIENDFVNTRIDRWIKKKLYTLPQSFIEKSLRLGKIKVNKIKVKSSYRLKQNDKIYVYNIKTIEPYTNNKLSVKQWINNSNLFYLEDKKIIIYILHL